MTLWLETTKPSDPLPRGLLLENRALHTSCYNIQIRRSHNFSLDNSQEGLTERFAVMLNPRRNTHWKLEVSGRRFYLTNHLANIYIFRINKRNTRKRREISSKLTIKAPERRQCHPSRVTVKGALSGLRQFLSTESPLKLMKNAFYFTSKALFVLKILKFFSWLFGHVAKRLDK